MRWEHAGHARTSYERMLRRIQTPEQGRLIRRGSTVQMRTNLFVSAALGAVAVLVAGSASAGTLDNVKQRAVLQCGSNTGLAGFGQPDAQGNWTGLDVE